MNILDRHIAAKFIGVFSRTIVSLIFLFVIIDLLTNRRIAIMEHDVPWTVVTQYYLYLIPRILTEYQLAALSILISGLLVLGGLAQKSEITAMLAGGIGLKRFVRYPVLIALGISLLIFAINETVGPAFNKRTLDIESRYFGQSRKGDLGRRSGVLWAHLPGGWKCDIQKFNRAAMTGEGVQIYTIDVDQIVRITARRIYWLEDSQEWMLEDGMWATYYDDQSYKIRRITQQPAPFNVPPQTLFASDVQAASITMSDLRSLRKTQSPLSKTGRRLGVDFHGKFAKPVLCFIMIWLAIPFAIRLGRGGLALGFSISIAVGLSYLVIYAVSQALGYAGQLSPPVAAWTANVMFSLIGLFLFTRTPT